MPYRPAAAPVALRCVGPVCTPTHLYLGLLRSVPPLPAPPPPPTHLPCLRLPLPAALSGARPPASLECPDDAMEEAELARRHAGPPTVRPRATRVATCAHHATCAWDPCAFAVLLWFAQRPAALSMLRSAPTPGSIAPITFTPASILMFAGGLLLGAVLAPLGFLLHIICFKLCWDLIEAVVIGRSHRFNQEEVPVP